MKSGKDKSQTTTDSLPAHQDRNEGGREEGRHVYVVSKAYYKHSTFDTESTAAKNTGLPTSRGMGQKAPAIAPGHSPLTAFCSSKLAGKKLLLQPGFTVGPTVPQNTPLG